MDEPVFLSKATVLWMQQRQIERFGGSHGLRDDKLLESALGAAKQCWIYTENIYQVAAQYCLSLAKNHAFVDGNKRIAAAVMLTFLSLNKHEPTMTADQLYDWVIAITTSQMDRIALAKLLEQHSNVGDLQ